MTGTQITKLAVASLLIFSIAACGGRGSGIFGRDSVTSGGIGKNERRENDPNGFSKDYDSAARSNAVKKGDSVFDLFRNNDDPNVTLRVNKYLWNASLDVLNFMPVQRADPFTGTISMGYGRPQGSSRAYRATVYITDPALDARALRVALQVAGGASVSTETVRAIEDAILTRARQLRIRDTKL
ncbi:MAG: DUF3576 domain-containing protein [Pseudomonadota bacterium]